MHVSIMNLAIPSDCEVLLNRFYDLPSGKLLVKPEYFDEGVEYSFALFYAKCALHQITVDWTTLPGETVGQYRIQAARKEGYYSNLMEFVSQDRLEVQEKLNSWLYQLVFPCSTNEEAREALEQEPHTPKYLLMPLAVPTGWRMWSNAFYDLTCDPYYIEKHCFSEDMLHLQSTGPLVDGCPCIVDLGWVPSNSPEGRYRINVVVNDFSDKIYQFENRDRFVVQNKLSEALETLNTYKNRQDILACLAGDISQPIDKVKQFLLSYYYKEPADNARAVAAARHGENSLEETREIAQAFQQVLGQGIQAYHWERLVQDYGGQTFEDDEDAYEFIQNIAKDMAPCWAIDPK